MNFKGFSFVIGCNRLIISVYCNGDIEGNYIESLELVLF